MRTTAEPLPRTLETTESWTPLSLSRTLPAAALGCRARRWGYSQLVPGVVIEALQHGPSGGGGRGAAEDLKCFSFHGRTHYVLHVSDRFEGVKHDTVYHRNGTLARGVTVAGSRALSSPEQSVFVRFPELLTELIRRCDAASAGLALMRVDYLLVQSPRSPPESTGDARRGEGGGKGAQYELLLGELTPYPGGGGFHWTPPSFDATLGELLAVGAPPPQRAQAQVPHAADAPARRHV